MRGCGARGGDEHFCSMLFEYDEALIQIVIDAGSVRKRSIVIEHASEAPKASDNWRYSERGDRVQYGLPERSDCACMS